MVFAQSVGNTVVVHSILSVEMNIVTGIGRKSGK